MEGLPEPVATTGFAAVESMLTLLIIFHVHVCIKDACMTARGKRLLYLVDWESSLVLRLSMLIMHLTLCNSFHPTARTMLAATITQLTVLFQGLFPSELVDP